MEYNNYYPAPPGHPPQIPNQQHGCSQMQIMPGSNMMHPSSMLPHQGMRQILTTGPPNHSQMQAHQQPPPPLSQQHQQPPPPPNQMMGPHHVPSQQQQHPNYHQIPPHPPLPHSASPHSQPHHNHQTNLNHQPPPRPSTGPSPHPHMHSPHHINGPPIHLQPSPQLNQLGAGPPPLLPPGLNPTPPGLQQNPQAHLNQSFMGPGPGPGPPISHSSPHYAQPSPHQQPPPPHNQAPPMQPMHHAPQNLIPTHIPHVHHPQNLDRGSPFYQNIPQSEFRIIELNKRLQNRPKFRGPVSPLPTIEASEEMYWWQKFACDFFDDDSTITFRILLDEKPVEFTIGRTLIPRFFKAYFDGGVVDLSVKLRNTRETSHHNLVMLECDHTDITTKNIFRHKPTNMAMNVVVHTEGHLSLEFVSNSFDTLLIKSWRFYTNMCHEYIDRSVTTTGLPNAFLVEPVTKHGLATSTISFLRMCMTMEPMQELMHLHRQTNMDPRSCMKHLLYDKYKLKMTEDSRPQPNRRRKRKTPAATGGTKKTKANANAISVSNSNNIGFNSNINNSLMSPPNLDGAPNLSLTPQDIMVVGEPSMLGADFGDENERRITRLENNQFDASVTTGNSAVQNQTQNQMCNNTGSQNQAQANTVNHLQHQPNNHDPGNGNAQLLNHTSTATNNNHNNGSNDLSNVNISNVNNCLQNNSSHQMNLINMNGNTNHMNHLVKSEMDLKQSSVPIPTATDSDAR